MVNPRQRRKAKNPNSKVSRRTKVVKRSVKDQKLGAHWDQKNTLDQNYQKNGIERKLNMEIGQKSTRAKLNEWNWKRREQMLSGEINGFDSEDEITKELDTIFIKTKATEKNDHKTVAGKDEATNGTFIVEPSVQTATPFVQEIEEFAKKASTIVPNKKKMLNSTERAYISKLVDKHGNNYQRMFMDIKLNTQQLSAYKLEQLAGRLDSSNHQ